MKLILIIGFALFLAAGLLFVAGSPTINMLPQNQANFWGIAAGAAGAFCWIAYGIARRGTRRGGEPGAG